MIPTTQCEEMPKTEPRNADIGLPHANGTAIPTVGPKPARSRGWEHIRRFGVVIVQIHFFGLHDLLQGYSSEVSQRHSGVERRLRNRKTYLLNTRLQISLTLLIPQKADIAATLDPGEVLRPTPGNDLAAVAWFAQ